jgi:protein phosphatase
MKDALLYSIAASTDIGQIRSNNQDVLLCRELAADQQLWLVADGVAGRDAGELASATCVTVFESLAAADKFEAARHADLAEPLLAMVVQKAHAEVSRLELQSRQKLSMSCTLTAALASGSRVDIVHVGDSRAYLLHEGLLTQITVDQTVARELISSGRLRVEQLARHPDRNTLSQSIGLESTAHPLTPAH